MEPALLKTPQSRFGVWRGIQLFLEPFPEKLRHKRGGGGGNVSPPSRLSVTAPNQQAAVCGHLKLSCIIPAISGRRQNHEITT